MLFRSAIITAVFLIFLVMAMQFESPIFSLMVMLSIPFSLIGSFFLLFISGSTLNMLETVCVGVQVNSAQAAQDLNNAGTTITGSLESLFQGGGSSRDP